MRLTTTFVLLACVAIAGCRETASCERLEHYDQALGRCVTGAPFDAGSDAPIDAGTDGGPPCGGRCVDADHCDPDTGDCFACIADSECTVATAPLCFAHECVGCENDDRCAELDATRPNCVEGTGECVACTAANETTVCGAFTCDIPTGRCTSIPPAVVGACGACGSDRQCQSAYRCIPMSYRGDPREGGFCLAQSTGSCTTRPWSTVLDDRVSLSGATEADYCGPNESLTTCEAVNALRNSVECTAPDAGPATCGDVLGAVCDTVGGNPNRCTYECGVLDDCPAGRTCGDPSGHCG